ncbi:PLEKHG1 family protein [Megaselia abdita]
MLNLYDKIKSTNFKETKSSEENLVEALASLEKLIDDRCGDGSGVKVDTMETTPPPPPTMTTTVNKHKSSCVLSQNVQRLVSHSQSSLTSLKQSTVSHKEKHINLIQGSHPQKIFHIPLSRNISKLTQSCDDLVETLDRGTQKLVDEMVEEDNDDEASKNSQSRKSSTSSGHSDTPTLVPSTPPPASALVSSSPSPRTSNCSTTTRPVSVCSTSSSSSSGSDNLHEKHVHGVSYLASVESLAEHSEGEHETGIRLTVFERACLEIVDSERNYVNDLGQIINGYLGDWRERACLKTDELNILFSNIESIYEFNKELLAKLEDSTNKTDPAVKIANCFINMKDGFSVYTTYCTSYPQAISLLTSLLQASHTNALLTSTQKMLQHNLPLGSYLLKPVQRILRYHLLLNNLKKNCDVDEVLKAYEIMCQVANDIDQVKRKLEQQSRVKELSGILDGWLGPELTVLGELKHEGMLMENNKHRMVFLFESMIIIAKPKEDSRLQFKHYINKKHLMLREHLPGEPTSFCIIPLDDPRNQIKLTAKNRELKKIWAHHIKEMMLELYGDIPNRAKELLFKLGDEEDRTPDKNTWKWSLNSSTPVYLERRNQYRHSEMRSRSKVKRKTLANNVLTQSKNDDSFDRESRKFSIDDNMIHSLPKMKSEEAVPAEEVEKRGSLKERSKSVPRRLSMTFRDSSNEDVKIKQYNNEHVPKRIANLKKNRSKENKKETSTFYVEVNEIGDTLLKITESTENLTKRLLNEDLPKEKEEIDSPDPINEIKQFKKDSEIISELLKDKIRYRKPQKKRSLDSCMQKTPPLPTSSPPPLCDDVKETIYETIIRNVTLNSKFSPKLNRSKSYNFSAKKKDYEKTSKSDSKLNCLPPTIQRNPSSVSSHSSPPTFISKRKEHSITAARRASENLELSRQNFLHLQGSEALGERMANTDYAVPSSLFKIQLLSCKQRDSAFSLTSSNDSVCDKKKSFPYEETVEACLENDFRDSAFYSDENMPICFVQATNKYIRYPVIPPKPKNLPPVKTKIFLRRQCSLPNEFRKMEKIVMNKSWVHAQIQNFSG